MFEWLAGLFKAIFSPKTAFTAAVGSLLALPLLFIFGIGTNIGAVLLNGADAFPDMTPQKLEELKKVGKLVSLAVEHLNKPTITGLILLFSFGIPATIAESFSFFQSNLRDMLMHGITLAAQKIAAENHVEYDPTDGSAPAFVRALASIASTLLTLWGIPKFFVFVIWAVVGGR